MQMVAGCSVVYLCHVAAYNIHAQDCAGAAGMRDIVSSSGYCNTSPLVNATLSRAAGPLCHSP